MTAIQKVIKYIAIAFAFFLIVTIIGGIISFVYEIGTSITTSEDKIIGEMLKNKFDHTKISKLNVDIGASNLIIKRGDELIVETNNENIVIEQEDDEIHIKQKKMKWKINSRIESEVIIYIPESFEFRTVKVDMGAGNVEVNSLTTDRFNLQLGAGKTYINNLAVKENCDIDGGTGEIEVKSSKMNNLDFDLGVGEAKIESEITGKSDIDAGVGSLNINLIGDEDTYRLHIEKGIGSIKINGNDVKNNTDYGEGENLIDIDGGIGDIKIKFKN